MFSKRAKRWGTQLGNSFSPQRSRRTSAEDAEQVGTHIRLEPSRAVLRGVEFAQNFCGVSVFWVEVEGFLVVGDGLGLVAGVHVGFAQAVVNIAGARIGFAVELEDLDGLFPLLRLDELVA